VWDGPKIRCTVLGVLLAVAFLSAMAGRLVFGVFLLWGLLFGPAWPYPGPAPPGWNPALLSPSLRLLIDVSLWISMSAGAPSLVGVAVQLIVWPSDAYWLRAVSRRQKRRPGADESPGAPREPFEPKVPSARELLYVRIVGLAIIGYIAAFAVYWVLT
jgi:hypothetical protein